MRFRVEQSFSAPLGDVEAAFTNPALIEHLATLPKLGHPTMLEQRRDDSQVFQRVRYAFAGQLSSVVTAVLDPARLTWVEESTHTFATHSTRFEILPDHYADKLRCGGQLQLEADGRGCRRTAEGDLTVPVPLVGRKVEAAIVSGLQEHADAEAEVLSRWLHDRVRP